MANGCNFSKCRKCFKGSGRILHARVATGAYRAEGEYAGELRCSFAQYLETDVSSGSHRGGSVLMWCRTLAWQLCRGGADTTVYNLDDTRGIPADTMNHRRRKRVDEG